MYKADILADSIGPHGVRLTTMEITFPRPYLAELNTHRVFSRNSESSRAIPTELQIARVRDQPYVPEFRVRTKGMGGGEFLEGDELAAAVDTWIDAAWSAAADAERLIKVAKDDANRLLEPFLWHTAIVTSTEWENFFALRNHEAAAVPMQRLAELMEAEYHSSMPVELEYGEWHTPLVGDPFKEEGMPCFYGPEHHSRGGYVPDLAVAKTSAGRCARSSYSLHNDPESADASIARWNRLAEAGHWSPGEHPAMCVEDDPDYDYGNFAPGWLQLRKFYDDEAVFQR